MGHAASGMPLKVHYGLLEAAGRHRRGCDRTGMTIIAWALRVLFLCFLALRFLWAVAK